MTRPLKGQRIVVRFVGYHEDGQAVALWNPAEVSDVDPGELLADATGDASRGAATPASGDPIDDAADGALSDAVGDAARGASGDAAGDAANGALSLWEIRAPGGARGEAAMVEIQHVSPHRSVAWARILEIRKKAPWRVRSFDGPEHRCGGCPWGHLSPEEALGVKTERLRALHAGFSGARLGEPPVQASRLTGGYRHRGKYVIGLDRAGSMGRGGRGDRQREALQEGATMGEAAQGGAREKSTSRPRVLLGAFAPRSHRVIRTVGCPVMCPAVNSAAGALERLLSRCSLPVYDESRREGLLRYAAIRSNHNKELLITLVLAGEPPGGEPPGGEPPGGEPPGGEPPGGEPPGGSKALEPLVRDLRREIQGLVGVTLDVNPSEGNALFSGSERVLFGQGAIWDRYGPVGVKLTGHGFSQVNREQAQAMYEAAATFALAPLAEGVLPRSIWELFAGAGALGQVIALRGKERQGLRILGVERDAASVRLAKEAAEAAGLSGCLEFIAQDAGVVMSRLLITLDLGPGAEDSSMRRDGRRPEVVVLDPPRSGCGPELLEALSGARIPRLVYLSCHQGSLARDLHRLVPGGYAVRYVQGFDMMPMTPHLEILAVLEQA